MVYVHLVKALDVPKETAWVDSSTGTARNVRNVLFDRRRMVLYKYKFSQLELTSAVLTVFFLKKLDLFMVTRVVEFVTCVMLMKCLYTFDITIELSLEKKNAESVPDSEFLYCEFPWISDLLTNAHILSGKTYLFVLTVEQPLPNRPLHLPQK